MIDKMVQHLREFFFQPEVQTASVAKDRLQIICRYKNENKKEKIDLQELQKEIMDLISSRFKQIDRNQVNVHLESVNGHATLELNIPLDEENNAENRESSNN